MMSGAHSCTPKPSDRCGWNSLKKIILKKMGNNGIVDDKIPMPCLDEDNEDILYLRKVFEFIEANDDKFDASRIYAEGGSQNSVFSAYLAFCFRFKSSTYLLLTKMLSANCLIFPSFFGSCFRREFFP